MYVPSYAPKTLTHKTGRFDDLQNEEALVLPSFCAKSQDRRHERS